MACLLYVPSGDNIFEQGLNFQSVALVRPFVVTGDHLKVVQLAKTYLEGKPEKDFKWTLESGRSFDRSLLAERKESRTWFVWLI